MSPQTRTRRRRRACHAKEKPFFPVVCDKLELCRLCDELVEDENDGGEIACDVCNHWFHLRRVNEGSDSAK